MSRPSFRSYRSRGFFREELNTLTPSPRPPREKDEWIVEDVYTSGMCEDYPCCGHEPNSCPDSRGQYPCATCGVRLPKGSRSSLCGGCVSRLHREWDEETGQW